MNKLGIIGGSGLYSMEGLEDSKWIKVDTPWGSPSDEILQAKLNGKEICFLPRHARGHKINPSNINFRANIDALKQLGVTDIISMSAVGSLKEDLEPGKFVIVDQFIDRTFARVKTFFDQETLQVFSLDDGLVIQLVRALLLVFGLSMASRFTTTSFRGALTLYLATISILGFLQVSFGTSLSTDRDLGDDIGFTVANLIWLFQLTLFVGMGKAFLSMGKKVEKAYDQYLSETDLAEIQQSKELMLSDRQLAQYLHGNMQARLNSIASRLEKRTKNTDIATELRLIEASLSEALSDFGSSRVSNLEDAVEGLKRDWGGVAQLAFALEPLELEQEEVQMIREVINEAISNAVRHGFASRVSTILSEGPKLVITDDGTGPRNGRPGLGTTYFDSVSDDWEIIDTASGAQLTLKLGKN